MHYDKATIGAEAKTTLAKLGIAIGADFHALRRSTVEALLAEAKRVRYRQHRQANGSKAMSFHTLLQKRALWAFTPSAEISTPALEKAS